MCLCIDYGLVKKYSKLLQRYQNFKILPLSIRVIFWVDVSLFDRKGFTVIQIVLLSEMFFTSTLLQYSLFDFFSS